MSTDEKLEHLGWNAAGNRIVKLTLPNGASLTYGLTLCCNASDKGVEDGVVCRACYSDENMGDVWDTDVVRTEEVSNG